MIQCKFTFCSFKKEKDEVEVTKRPKVFIWFTNIIYKL